MSNNRFYIGDTHFGHTNILTFKRQDGTPLRSFSSIYEMDGYMVSCWNSVVKEGDTVYHLGDIALQKPNLSILRALKGRKILIMGNHDRAGASEYLKYFADIRALDRKEGIICTHIPIHPSSLGRFGVNVHGHTHTNSVLTETGAVDPRYFNVSVEQIAYVPLEYSELMRQIKLRQETYEQKAPHTVF